MPERLFKFYSANEYSLAVLRNKQLYFSHPANFNDPFDCKLLSLQNYSKSDLGNLLLQRQNSHEDFFLIGQALKLSIIELQKLYNDALKRVKEHIRVCCFTNNWNNPLMWAHYSNSHSGFCLEFDRGESPEAFDQLVAVNYVNKPKVVDLINDLDDSINIVSHKSDIWSYENEFRVVKNKHHQNKDIGFIDSDLVNFLPKALISVTFGVNTTQKTIQTILDILKASEYRHVKKYKIELEEKSYELKRVPYPS